MSNERVALLVSPHCCLTSKPCKIVALVIYMFTENTNIPTDKLSDAVQSNNYWCRSH